MCGRLNNYGRSFRPGAALIFSKHGKPTVGLWGFKNGEIYNARSERLLEGMWKPLMEHNNRGIIEVRGFYEGPVFFFLENFRPMHLAVIYNEQNEFAIITEPAKGLVAKVHNRMPMIVPDDNAWVIASKIAQYDASLIRMAA